MDGRTIVTAENAAIIDAYIESKHLHAQEEEVKRAARAGEEPRAIPKLGKIGIQDVLALFPSLYRRFAPAASLQAIAGLLREWANAKAPSEVEPEGRGLPAVSTQDNSFPSVSLLFLALAGNVVAEPSKQLHESVAFAVLEALDFYLPVINEMLGHIEARLKSVSTDLRLRIVREGYARFLIDEPSALQSDLIKLIINQESESLRRLFLGVNTIHSYAVHAKQLAPQRRDIAQLSQRRDKYSPSGPEIERAREMGYAVWSGLSGSTADILNLAQNFGVSSADIHRLAYLAAAFFYFLPTSKNPTHTLHEVMFVAKKFFGVPYDPAHPLGTLPHVLGQASIAPPLPGSRLKRIGEPEPAITEFDVSELVVLHNVPRKGVPQGNIDSIVKLLRERGYDLRFPVSATLLPNGTLLVTGGHHRVAAMRLLGERTVPVKVYGAEQTPMMFMAKMVGIARITGKFHSVWIPPLTDLEKVEVNLYLAEWMRQNDDQVKNVFLYPLKTKVFPPTSGLYPDLDREMSRRARL